MRGIEVVVRDIRQTEVVTQLRIEELIFHATSQTDTTIETLEALVVERAVSLTMTKVLDLTSYAKCQIASEERLDVEVIIDIT